MFVGMTIHNAGRYLLFQLHHAYDEREAGNITDWVMENITGWKKIDRVINKTALLSEHQSSLLEKYTEQLLSHKPVQYVLHESFFYGMKLYVDENVLIPRPETEELVQWIITDQKVNNIINSPLILDIGTGSGCIAIAIKKNLPIGHVHACDSSEGALAVAQKNAIDQKTVIDFYQLNFLSEKEWDALPGFDIIASNPPYIPLKDKAEMSRVVLENEPHIALFVENENQLLFYEAIAKFAPSHLSKQGTIYVEIHESLGREVQELFSRKGFTRITIKNDMQGKDRMIKAQW